VIAKEEIQRKFDLLGPVLDERQRRLYVAAEALVIGRGGITAVSEATGIAVSTVRRGIAELQGRPDWAGQPMRRPGGGRRKLAAAQTGLMEALEGLVSPATRGDPESPLRWSSKSTTKLAEALRQKGFVVSADTVGRLLKEMGYSLQSTRKRLEGTTHANRDQQFELINARARDFEQRDQPVVSVDTKKKELVGEFANRGQEWQPKGQPVPVNVHDFPSLGSGKAVPYGVYDIGANEGWVSVGCDHDTAEFAVETIHRWWRTMGQPRYPGATELLITADCGGSNGYRTRLWKLALQRFADETGLIVTVAHLPPGTSKWNKIEHRLFSHITQNWRGRPLVTHETVVQLIGRTTTTTGLTVRAELDQNSYPKGVNVSDEEIASLNLRRDNFQGDWNYTLSPHN
jgi:transposase